MSDYEQYIKREKIPVKGDWRRYNKFFYKGHRCRAFPEAENEYLLWAHQCTMDITETYDGYDWNITKYHTETLQMVPTIRESIKGWFTKLFRRNKLPKARALSLTSTSKSG
jgi:hypothetical protein